MTTPATAIFEIAANLPFDGRWMIVVNGGGDAVSLPLVVTGWEPPPPPQSFGI
ncbi:MAG: hypothetical protein QOH91_1055 [Mycobacterium sp.]|nr:hypothetical protein [Mycobacterium sp.]